jgi:hypothetical protein
MIAASAWRKSSCGRRWCPASGERALSRRGLALARERRSRRSEAPRPRLVAPSCAPCPMRAPGIRSRICSLPTRSRPGSWSRCRWRAMISSLLFATAFAAPRTTLRTSPMSVSSASRTTSDVHDPGRRPRVRRRQAPAIASCGRGGSRVGVRSRRRLRSRPPPRGGPPTESGPPRVGLRSASSRHDYRRPANA